MRSSLQMEGAHGPGYRVWGGAGAHPNFRHCSGQTSRPRRRGAAHLCRALRITGNLVSSLHTEAQAGADPGALLTQTPSVPLPPPHCGGPSVAPPPPVLGAGTFDLFGLKSIPRRYSPGTCPRPPRRRHRPDGLIPSLPPAQGCPPASPPPH